MSAQRYRTIVADPPWHYSATSPPNPRCGTCHRLKYHYGHMRCECVQPDFRGNHYALPYTTMHLEEIVALPVADFAHEDGAHLYLWTTNRYLRDAYDVVAEWGFRSVSVLVWSKAPKGMGGTWIGSTEFCLFARRGSAPALSQHLGTCFTWPRAEHSRKPDAFLDLVEQVSPGPYLEMFARRARLGWDVWGDEVDSHVDVLAGHKSGQEHRNAVPERPQGHAEPTGKPPC